MSSRRDQHVMTARELDQSSTALIRMGERFVRRNPIKVSLYFLGVILCLFFSGFSVSEQQRAAYTAEFQKIDHAEIARVETEMEMAYRNYYRNKGWFFTCNAACKETKSIYDSWRREFEALKKQETKQIATAKSKLGLLSEYGIEETKDVFWHRFAAGKTFAKRQSMFDMLFLGVGAMSRDDSFLEYVVRVVLNVLMNFTIGVFMAVVTFIFSLYSIIASYQASFLTGSIFFFGASLAAISFALSWIVGLYCFAAGAAYVGFTVAKGALRLEGGGAGGHRDRIR